MTINQTNFVLFNFQPYIIILLLMQENKFLKFLSFMWNPLSWVMEAAAVMAIVLANGGVSLLYPAMLFSLHCVLQNYMFLFFLLLLLNSTLLFVF